jgi:hypothetical protein
VVFRRIDESYGPRSAPDVAGLSLVTGAALGIVWGLVRGNSAGWGSAEVIATLVIGVLLTVVFVLWERRTAEPMLPMGLFALRPFASGNAGIFFMCTSLYGAVFFMAQFLQIAQHHGPLAAGIRCCRGQPRCSSSLRSRARGSAGWASDRSPSPGCSYRRPGWGGSR